MERLTIALILGAAVCSAGPITYNVNQTVGAGGVTGTIVTDGTTGTLAVGDVTGWDLFLNDGSGSGTVELKTTNSMFVDGGDLSATASNLLFNFSNSDSGFFFFELSGGTFPYWCSEPDASICMVNTLFTGPGQSLDLDDTNPNTEQFTAYTGTQVVASTSSSPLGTDDPDPIGTPEPSTFSFLGLGIAVLGFWKYRTARVNV
jgi:hypothetical protein